ncbi:MAG: CAAX protease [Pegethrix bostrychoides GSE-TBD4-15B]|jgi:predicted Abi (CAAX) family protease/uncharacterized integral membrane protein|uniref:CAAX protease n=1 Tax=Pegethrix bostrychoides GSE-TBD4-15B TaxID=2839662 RepID=A0A951P740_9CYAN|nr:CAAX protease [Pegethrix bostrychoides GSE-TBD4-15B]
MTEIWKLWGDLTGAIALNPESIRQVVVAPTSLSTALLIVLLAGLSLAVGQVVILFVNQVKPARFIFSLLLNAVLFTCGFLFLVSSTWLICQIPGSVRLSFSTLVKLLGLSYAPLLFGFLGALPYLGVPLLNLLSIWRLLAAVVGFGAVADISVTAASGYLMVGWLVLQLLENTIGQPIASLGKALAERVAGVELADHRSELAERVKAEMGVTSPLTSSTPPASPLAPPRSAPRPSAQASARSVRRQQIQLLVRLLGMLVLFVTIALLLRPVRANLFAWSESLPRPFGLVLSLVWLAILALVFAGILAPLETMGWWAGWYGDGVNTSSLDVTQPDTRPDAPRRYAIYLDGIGQSGATYTPDVETFLETLRPRLPADTELVRGLMMYSVLNQPLDQDRPLSFLWRLAERKRLRNPTAFLSILLNLRNVLIVAVSADQRYGPIYNRGIAQVLYNGLLERGYRPGSGKPITLIGYSGGANMSVAAAPYLKQALGAPIEVISLGGVISANSNFLKLGHLYHLVGEKDGVERIGPVMFPGRWKLFFLSYWNRAQRRGIISLHSMGAVGHQVPGGYLDPDAQLPDGRSHLQQTVDVLLEILNGKLLEAKTIIPRQLSNYSLYQQAAFNHPDYYPLSQSVDPVLYRPIGSWMGRLILPDRQERARLDGVWLEVHHAPDPYSHLVGQRLRLHWLKSPSIQQHLNAVTRDVHFSAEAEYTSRYGGLIHPERINHWRQVDPLESLAGSHPTDDLIVMLEGEVKVDELVSERLEVSLGIVSQPVLITGRYYGLVRFVQPLESDQFRVVHFNAVSRQFDGASEVLRLPPVILSQSGSFPSTSSDLEKSAQNETGWYIYGAKDAQGQFVVQSLGPRSLFRLCPDQVRFGAKAGYDYIRRQSWADPVAHKGQVSSVLCAPERPEWNESLRAAVEDWQVGDRALVLHTYGGIGGRNQEPAAATPIFFGHFAYGLARVVHEPLADERRFDLQYYQVYTHNTDGLVAGTLHWSRYLGDRQFGWLGSRPTCDLLIKLDAFTGSYDLQNRQISPLNTMIAQLQVMTARYRIGDGTGGTYVGPANNCAQDSNQALFASIRVIEQIVQQDPAIRAAIESKSPEQAQRLDHLIALRRELERALQPLGGPRSDWEENELNLGSTLEDNPLQNLWTGLGSWRTMLPRLASDTVARIFLREGAAIWVLRTSQVGGYDPDIEPIAPTRF